MNGNPGGNGLQRVWQKLQPRLHLMVLLPVLPVLLTAPFLLLGRRLRDNASLWDLLHVYLGLLLVPISLLLLISCVVQGRWRQFFPLWGSDALRQDIKALASARLPKGGGSGLFSLLEGLCALFLVAVALTGLGWYCTEGSAEALSWRAWHKDLAIGFVVLLALHVLAALSHLVDFFRQ
ncbi:cytochrome b/b6 domain-containing protein [Shewanella litorisediminis]|uniref:Cytochrome b/b6 domain-containing protein n=1 Tax=Shewanella litorisediminis TaxID=1173586 RepID=A0ABX7G1B3_9GAMM|nr:cytochrome b/b6 domain-containing protein [Shewanella litorisediminis]MCL2919067.1 cytochrome b/b6 domain-containing protein [Shewanella litorisediminis]QRH01127.1 cytochrome b/b6 domain-containing protein [Shewanella litorisediminis]